MFSFLVFALQAKAVSCQDRFIDWKKPSSICQTWSANPAAILETFMENGIPYEVPNPSVIDQEHLPAALLKLTSKANVNDKQVAIMAEQFESLKRTMISEITRDQPGTLNQHRRYLKGRVESAKLAVLSESSDSCQPPTQFNARYEARTNTISVCPLTTHLPRQAWLPLVSHELGHLADPCTYTQTYSFTAKMPEARENIALAVETCLKSKHPAPSKEDLTNWVNKIAEPRQVKDRAASIERGFSRVASESLKACGLLAETTDPTPPEIFAEHPYFKFLQCVSRGVHAPVTEQTPTSSRAHCDSAQETDADQIGFTILDAHFRKNPDLLRTHGDLIGYFYASTNCSRAEHQSGDRTYASSMERMRNFLSLPVIRQALKCEGEMSPPTCRISD